MKKERIAIIGLVVFTIIITTIVVGCVQESRINDLYREVSSLKKENDELHDIVDYNIDEITNTCFLTHWKLRELKNDYDGIDIGMTMEYYNYDNIIYNYNGYIDQLVSYVDELIEELNK